MNTDISQNIKEHLKTLTPQQIKTLTEIQRYWVFVMMMRSNGVTNIILGFLNLGLAALNSNTPLSIVQLVFGVALIIQSILAYTKPSLGGLLRFIVLVGFAGIWNTTLGAVNGLYGANTLVAIFGLVQVWWAYKAYRVYREYQANPPKRTDVELSNLYDETFQALSKAQIKTDPDLIEIDMQRNRWRGWLLGDYAVFTHKNKADKRLLWTEKSEVVFAPYDVNQITKRYTRGYFKIGELISWGGLKRESLGRYQQWKPVDDPTTLHTTAYVRKHRLTRLVGKIALGGAALLLGFVVLMTIVVINTISK